MTVSLTSAFALALVDSTTALSGACPTTPGIIDLVGFGAANCAEGAATPTLSNATAAFRILDGTGREVDTDSNLADFTVGAEAERLRWAVETARRAAGEAGRETPRLGAYVNVAVDEAESAVQGEGRVRDR